MNLFGLVYVILIFYPLSIIKYSTPFLQTVKNALRRKFLGALNEAEMGPSFNIREHVDMRNLLQRYQDLTGIKILPDSLSVLVYGTSTMYETPPASLQRVHLFRFIDIFSVMIRI